VIDSDGNLLEEPFSTSNAVVPFEQGLQDWRSIRPQAENGLFYVNYTDLLRAGGLMTVQFQVSRMT